MTTYTDKVFFKDSSNARGDTPAEILLEKNLRHPVVGLFEDDEKLQYKPSSNNETKELT